MAKLKFLESLYAKLFYLIQEFQKQQYITEIEKSHIKDLIIQKHSSVYNLLYSQNDQDLEENLIKLIRNIRLQIEQQCEYDNVSTSKSLKVYKLKLNLKQSNFNLAINKK